MLWFGVYLQNKSWGFSYVDDCETSLVRLQNAKFFISCAFGRPASLIGWLALLSLTGRHTLRLNNNTNVLTLRLCIWALTALPPVNIDFYLHWSLYLVHWAFPFKRQPASQTHTHINQTSTDILIRCQRSHFRVITHHQSGTGGKTSVQRRWKKMRRGHIETFKYSPVLQTTYVHGNPFSAGSCVQHNDLSGCLSAPVSVFQPSALGRLGSATIHRRSSAPARSTYTQTHSWGKCAATYPRYF